MILLSSYPVLIYPKVSFHGFALPPSALFLDDAAAMGGVCWSGLWLKVCLSGPEKEKKREMKTGHLAQNQNNNIQRVSKLNNTEKSH